jgi:hypothetical protein
MIEQKWGGLTAHPLLCEEAIHDEFGQPDDERDVAQNSTLRRVTPPLHAEDRLTTEDFELRSSTGPNAVTRLSAGKRAG